MLLIEIDPYPYTYSSQEQNSATREQSKVKKVIDVSRPPLVPIRL